jgi:hypothetical protein
MKKNCQVILVSLCLFYTADFTIPVFFLLNFSTAIKIVLKFLPSRNEVKNARHMQSCWFGSRIHWYQKKLNESSMLKTCTGEVYAISKYNGSDKEVDKPKKNVPQNLTPVTIMVVDTISLVRSRRLLNILWDSGSTTTLVNKKYLPHKKCKPCQISQKRMVNTLASSYQMSATVVICNLRLPALD